jgi:peptidoglycan/LPS O-acetylase OafA/YrhL
MSGEIAPLTAIRGFAALWVVGHHVAASWYPGSMGPLPTLFLTGYAAVDTFFVLSGFILATVYQGLTASGTPLFFLRRLCRIYPLHLSIMAALAVAAVAAPLFGGSSSRPWAQFVWVSLMLQPYLLPESTWNPPSWSVGVELLCYALFPPALWLIRRWPVLLLAALAPLLAAAEFRVLETQGGAVVGAGAILRGLTGFSLGVTLGCLAKRVPPMPERLASLWQLASLAGIGAAIAQGWSAPAGPFSGLLILCLASDTGIIARLLRTGWCVRLGTISYSIYLLHAPLLAAFGKLSATWNDAGRVTTFLVLLLAASELSYRLVEVPGRRLPAMLTRRNPVQRSALSVGRRSSL